MDKISPTAFGIDHNEWRDGQYETVQWLLSPLRKPISIVSAVTGSGKSATSAALGSQGRRVRTLTATRALQKQYSNSYDYEELFGMSAYPCALFSEGLGLGETMTAEHCTYPSNMHKCPMADECEYLVRKKLVQDHRRQALSYAYFFTSNWTKKEVDFLYADECHNLPKLLMDHYAMEIDEYIAQKSLGISRWNPLISKPNWGTGKSLAIDFLSRGVDELTDQIDAMPKDPRRLSPSLAIHLGVLRSWRENMSRIRTGLQKGYPYYIQVVEAESRGEEAYRGDKLVISPLTARDLFQPAFLNGELNRIVLTSATVGESHVFGNLLGLDANKFEFYSVPSRFKPEDMPVFCPPDSPHIGHRSTGREIDKQAEVIGRLIDSMGKTATGLVHFSSKRATYDMADRLARIGYQDRLYVTPESGGTEQRVEAFKAYQQYNPGTIHLTWCMWEGYDGFDDQFSIVAKAPYPQENDLVAMQRKFDGGNFYSWSTAIMIEQGVGRVRRGDESHYGPNADKLTAVVDRNALKLKPYFSEHFQKCLVTN